MTLVLKCSDLIPGCDYETRGETLDEILLGVASHAKKVHGFEVTPELAKLIKGVIRKE